MKLIALLVLLIFITSCTNGGNTMNVKLNVDNIQIAGTYYDSNSSDGVILLHMLPNTKEAYKEYGKELQKDYKVIAIDFRGFGESDLDWKTFDDNDWNKLVDDVHAAREYLESNGVNKINIIGASIGANTALNYAAENKDVNAIVLLSPGLNYRGIKTDKTIKQFDGNILIIVNDGDTGSYEDSKKLSELNNEVVLKVYKGNKHGTNMLNSEVKNLIKGFIK